MSRSSLGGFYTLTVASLLHNQLLRIYKHRKQPLKRRFPSESEADDIAAPTGSSDSEGESPNPRAAPQSPSRGASHPERIGETLRLHNGGRPGGGGVGGSAF